MFKIVKKEFLAPIIVSMDVEAPRIASAAQPGQFLIIIVDDKGERVPLTICDSNAEEGTINIVLQTVGYSTERIAALEEGDYLRDVVGPLGEPSSFAKEDIEEVKKKKYLFVGGGVGVAPVYPQVKWFKERGMDVDVIIGAKTEELLILEDKMKEVAGNLYPCTDDGSYGFNGMVTAVMEDLVKNKGKEYDEAIIIGPMIMMKFATMLTKELGIKSTVSLNPIMVDGTGMCGACRVNVGGETKFACVDGPEFDGHLVDWDLALKRASQYKEEEEELAKKGERKECTCQQEGGAK